MEAVQYPSPFDRLAYTVLEVAEYLRLSTDKVYELIRSNRLPHKRLGRRIIIPRKSLERWLEEPDEWESDDG